MKRKGSYLNNLWNVGAAHALYIHDGHWYHRLERFPGALFDLNGYLLFETEEEYRSSPYLNIGKHISIRKPGISAIPGYVRVAAPSESRELPSDVHAVDTEGKVGTSVEISSMGTLAAIVDEINLRAASHHIGTLQMIRRDLKGKRKLPARKIFSRQTTYSDYAFHHGGRTELQFNVGIETTIEVTSVRHGVAFSLEPSQSLPSIEVLIPKVLRFNEFLKVHPNLLGDLRMWHYDRDVRSTNYMPAPIAPELIRPQIFVCLGRMQPVGAVNIELILADFDRLLPLYQFVEGRESFPTVTESSPSFIFRPGCAVKRKSTVAHLSARPLDVQLRHNELQEALYYLLAKHHGKGNVGTEQPTSTGVRVDVVLRLDSEYWFFEIKTSFSARACIREALAQLLEYAYWPGAQEASRLIVIGEPPLDPEAKMYLTRLRSLFALPIDYQQLDLDLGILKGSDLFS